MKEITRIHIAKIAYDIELDAKKDIQKYITALESYADDRELLDDIEIRITELLAERGVQAGGVIAKDDVAGVRERLGEPSEFAPEGVNDVPTGLNEVDDTTRKLYRDNDSAIIGGVLAGVARFFRIDPIWTRLIFIVLLFGSFGTAIIIYLILWIVVPPARTAAEKLQMRGRPVTLESIKQLGEHGDLESPAAKTIRRILRYGLGASLLIGAIGALLATISVAGGIMFGATDISPVAMWQPMDMWWFILALGLFTLAGLLLAALGFILADAVFRKHWGRRVATAVVVIITVGLLSFSSGIAVIAYGHQQEVRYLQASVKETKRELPREFASIKRLVASAHTITSGDGNGYSELSIQYRVSTEAPHYVLTALPDITPDFKTANGQARVVLKSSATQQYARGSVIPKLVIYGPALDTVSVEQGMFEYIANYPEGQSGLKLSTLAMTQVTLQGSFDMLSVEGAGQVDTSTSTVTNLVANLEPGSMVQSGVVRTLKVVQPDVCPAHEQGDEQSRLTVQAVSSGKFTYNGSERNAKTVDHDCGKVIIGNEDLE